MKTYRRVVFGVLSLLLATSAMADWKSYYGNDPMEGKFAAVVSALPDIVFFADRKLPAQGTFSLMCVNKKVEIRITSKFGFDYTKPVSIKFDGEGKETFNWHYESDAASRMTASSGNLIYPKNNAKFIKRLMKGNTLLMKVPFTGIGVQLLSLNLKGFTKQSRKLRQVCDL